MQRIHYGAKTEPRGEKPEPKPSRNLLSTVRRRVSLGDHRPPSGRHAGGREQARGWKGTSRIVDRPGRNAANAASWRRLVTPRREAVDDDADV